MDTEDLLPRLAVAAGLVAALVVYSRRRSGKLKKVQSSAASLPGDAAAAASETAATITSQSQSIIENMLDTIAEQAIKELKVVIKDGLKRLEKTVDAL